jgi:hypothetical protein
LVPYIDSIIFDDGLHLILPLDQPNHFANHSCDPNLWWGENLTLVARARSTRPKSSQTTTGRAAAIQGGRWNATADHLFADKSSPEKTGSALTCESATASTGLRHYIGESRPPVPDEPDWRDVLHLLPIELDERNVSVN